MFACWGSARRPAPTRGSTPTLGSGAHPHWRPARRPAGGAPRGSPGRSTARRAVAHRRSGWALPPPEAGTTSGGRGEARASSAVQAPRHVRPARRSGRPPPESAVRTTTLAPGCCARASWAVQASRQVRLAATRSGRTQLPPPRHASVGAPSAPPASALQADTAAPARDSGDAFQAASVGSGGAPWSSWGSLGPCCCCCCCRCCWGRCAVAFRASSHDS